MPPISSHSVQILEMICSILASSAAGRGTSWGNPFDASGFAALSVLPPYVLEKGAREDQQLNEGVCPDQAAWKASADAMW